MATTDKTYPLYLIRARWSEACEPGSDQVGYRDLPPLPDGRCWNSVSWDMMFRSKRDPEDIRAEQLRDWWPKYALKRREPADLVLEVKYLRHDSWCQGWFSHWTFRDGMSDEEVLASFDRYVDGVFRTSQPWEAYDRLAGAADRWRWHGYADGDPQGQRTPAPCNCEHCRAQGIVRIAH